MLLLKIYLLLDKEINLPVEKIKTETVANQNDSHLATTPLSPDTNTNIVDLQGIHQESPLSPGGKPSIYYCSWFLYLEK